MSRFRVYPTPGQETALLGHCAHARYVWNLACEQHTWWSPRRGAAPGYTAQNRQLTAARAEFPWLAAGSVTVQQQALRDFRQAMTNFFNDTHCRPTWRKAGVHEGFRIVGRSQWRVVKLSRRWSAVLVPKVGWVKLRRTRSIPDASSFRVTRDRAGRWHIAFAAVPDPAPAPGTGETAGVDRGVTVSAAVSDGGMLTCPGLTLKQRERLLRLQRRAARQHTRGRPQSGRERATRAAIAKLRAVETDRRKDWIEKTSTHLALSFDLIRVEDLDVRAMTRSASGTPDQPGSRVKQKARLNRGILTSGWGLLVTRLQQKAPGRVQKIPPALTSQRCSACGHVAAESRESQAVFRCVACRAELHADANAAANIAAGRAVTAHGDLQPLGGSGKCEAAGNREEVPALNAA